MSELLPCPFCGGEAHHYAPGPIDHHIECVNYKECGADIARDTEAEAIAAWNSRAERTCHDTGECRWFCCSECGCGINDAYINEEIKYGVFDDTFPRYCPNCGARAVDK